MDLQNVLERASHAKALLDNPVYQEVWAKGRGYYLERMAEERDELERNVLWQALQVFQVVKEHVEAIINEGNKAVALDKNKIERLKECGTDRSVLSRARTPESVRRAIAHRPGQ